MISISIYPKEENDIQLGVRRIPLHYLPKELGGNGQLQHNIIDLCNLQKIYVECKDEDIKAEHKETFNKMRTYLQQREQITYTNLLNVINLDIGEYKEQIHDDLNKWYNALQDLFQEIKIGD